MTNFLKIAFLALALVGGVGSITSASAMSDGLKAACESNAYTPHGIWDCR